MNKPAYIIMVCIIVSTLINVDYFCNSSLAAYFLFVISSSALIFFTGIKLIIVRAFITKVNYAPFIFLFLLVIYYLSQVLITADNVNTIHFYLLSNALLLLSLSFLITNKIINPTHIHNIITVIAILESAVCILQFMGLLNSQNQFLKVSGTWINPNVTAMFLAMSVPAALSFSAITNARFSFLLRYVLLFIIVIAIVLLQCRTAMIGSVVAVAIIINNRYGISDYFKSRYGIVKSIIIAIQVFAVMAVVALQVYKAKQASADGRKLVWKISANMAFQHPVTGTGYGNFAHDYNLEQAKYFMAGYRTAQEKNNASFVSTAYNEFLQNAVEGGLIGLALFTLFIASLLISFKEKNAGGSKLLKETALPGIVAFIIMSCVNFSIQAIPAMCLFMIYASILLANTQSRLFYFLHRFKPLLSIILLLFGVTIFFSQISLAGAFVKTKNALERIKDGNNTDALEILQPLSNKMENSETYWIAYGDALYNKKLYKQALVKYNRASTITSTPGLYMNIGNCYFKLHQFDSAILACSVAKNIAPGHIRPRYALMKIYEAMNDTVSTIKAANDLILAKPKIPSKETDSYKTEATKLLASLKQKIKS